MPYNMKRDNVKGFWQIFTYVPASPDDFSIPALILS